jgi:large subunit ribosomal protein L13
VKTYAPKPRDIERRWYVLDAQGAVLGRLASEAAAILRGKHKPIFAPHMDTGDHVIVVNAKGIELTGGKRETKVAYRHSGYPGGLTETKYGRLLAERPSFAVEKAIRGMLPKNSLGRSMRRKLHVYDGPTHRHEAQMPKPLELGEVPPWEGLPKREATPPPSTSKDAKPAAKRATANRAAAAPATKAATAKKSTAKRTTAAAAKKSTAKPTAKKSTAKRTTARRTKED